jgi:hypothetical protein
MVWLVEWQLQRALVEVKEIKPSFASTVSCQVRGRILTNPAYIFPRKLRCQEAIKGLGMSVPS